MMFEATNIYRPNPAFRIHLDIFRDITGAFSRERRIRDYLSDSGETAFSRGEAVNTLDLTRVFDVSRGGVFDSKAFERPNLHQSYSDATRWFVLSAVIAACGGFIGFVVFIVLGAKIAASVSAVVVLIGLILFRVGIYRVGRESAATS